MQKATPLILISFLAITAIFLSLRSHETPQQKTAAAVEIAPIKNTPKPIEPALPPKNEPAPRKITPQPWPQASSDIKADANASYGTLDNGFRYIIYPNAEPPKRLSLRLHIAAGSLMESENQRGVAHFLEHMVFNGTKHFSADDLVPRMQRLGIAFGAHVNAYTSFDETVYMLDLPDLSEDTLKLTFDVMRDFGDGALLAEEEINKERGVILSEKISRDSVQSRIQEQQFVKILPDSLIALRFPIGIEDVIQSAPRERFVDLYSRFYTPSRMTFVVVGDIKPEEARKRIEDTFSSMKNPAQPGSNPDLGKIHQPEGLEPAVFHDKELSSTDVSLILVRPHVHKPDTAANRAEELPLEIANSIITRRFERLSKEKNSPVASGSASKFELFNFADLGSIDVTAADDRWKEAVPIIEKEFRRAMEYGFTELELTEGKSNLLNAYEQQVKQKATRKSDDIATELVKSINDETVFSNPETDLDLAKKSLDTIDLAACHNAFKKFWEASGYHLILTTKEQPADAEKELAALFEESRGTPLEAPSAKIAKVFDYSNFGKPGKIATRKEIPDLAITQLTLSNKVRINLKRTDFEQGKIRMLVRIGSGKLTQPKDMPMLDAFATAIFEGGGLGKHSNDDLQQILAGKNVGASLTIDEDAFSLSGATTPADFTIQCQLMCASITDPGYREEALWQFQKAIPMIEQQLKHTPAGPQQEMEGWLHGGDSRFSPASAEKLTSYTIDNAKNWLTPELTKGYLELTIVGDFDPAVILPDLLATFGALPPRAATPPPLADARKVKFPNAPAAKIFTYETKIPQATAIAFWKTTGVRDNQKEFRRFNLLAEILGDRLREEIREKLGASYSPNAAASGSNALEGMGFILTESVGKPEDLDKLLTTMRDQADKLATLGATADELDRALKPTLGQLEKSHRDNTYWLSTVMSQSQADPKRLELARTRDADYKSINLAEINSLAKKYLVAGNTLLVSIKPKE
ncbi:MAG: insulinase family protein [Gloeobacteraceae cyanobacterium ES-bin-144]|nr:insulinase family protein [Verrucomicrobiales bacterium]